MRLNASLLQSLDKNDVDGWIASLTDKELAALKWDWGFWARPEQLEPEGDMWDIWLVLAGRGFGKTRTGAEWIRQNVYAGRKYFALVAPTSADARDVMIEGESGLLSVFPKHERPLYEPSKRRITFHTGATGILYSAEDPDQLRGQQAECSWCDELAAWKYMQETWDMLQFGMRLGSHPRQIVTTTPKPYPLIKELVAAKNVVVIKGKTKDNAANLSAIFLDSIVSKYEGTRLGRQELDAEILDDFGEIFKPEWIKRVATLPDVSTLSIYGGSDYAVTSGAGDYTVHAVVGVDPDNRMYLLNIWRQQTSSDEWVRSWCDLVLKYRPYAWAEETGQIKSGIAPFRDAEARRRGAYTRVEVFPTRGNKEIRAQSMIGRMATYGLYVPQDAPWLEAFVDELLSFPNGGNDDQVDAIGLVGQLLDKMVSGKRPKPEAQPKTFELRGNEAGRIQSNMTISQMMAQKELKRRLRDD